MPLALRCRVLLIIALPTIALVSSRADDTPDLDRRAKNLLAAFDALKGQRSYSDAWKPQAGPWEPFLKESMTAALSRREQKLYDDALRLGAAKA